MIVDLKEKDIQSQVPYHCGAVFDVPLTQAKEQEAFHVRLPIVDVTKEKYL
jgi:hypothetical protein